MVEFRKWLPALAIIALLLGASMASAQSFTCVSAGANPPTVRGEGIAELLGDVVLRCSGGTVTPLGALVPGVNISLFLNTNITSRLLDTGVVPPLTEALLLIDDPAPGSQLPCVPPTGRTTCGFTGTGIGASTGAGVNGTGAGGVNYTNGSVPNVYQGQLVTQPATNQQNLFWGGVPIDAPGTAGFRTIRITNVRGDARFVGVSTTFLPNQIIAFVSINAPSGIAIPNIQQAVGVTVYGLGGFSLLSGGSGTATTLQPFLQCVGASPSNPNPAFRAHITEGFASAFKPRGNIPGAILAGPTGLPVAEAGNFPSGYNATAGSTAGQQNIINNQSATVTETGFYAGGSASFSSGFFPSDHGLSSAGLATQGTRLLVQFANIPANVTLYTGLFEQGTVATVVNNVASRLVLICGADANGQGGSPCTAGTTVSNVSNLSAVTLSNGAGYAVYEVIISDPATIEQYDIPVYVSFTANAGGLTVENARPTVSVALAPLSTVFTASATAPVPRFVYRPLTSTAFVINPCRTNLLFPFVTNQFGFDTGIAISNTSQDPFGTTVQDGPCTLNYYGSLIGGGAAPGPQRTTAPVAHGTTFTMTLGLGSGTTFGVPGATGFSGYIIATCDFQYAHGFAFITDGPIGTARVAEGYLALVMDNSISPARTGYVSEPLNQ